MGLKVPGVLSKKEKKKKNKVYVQTQESDSEGQSAKEKPNSFQRGKSHYLWKGKNQIQSYLSAETKKHKQ